MRVCNLDLILPDQAKSSMLESKSVPSGQRPEC